MSGGALAALLAPAVLGADGVGAPELTAQVSVANGQVLAADQEVDVLAGPADLAEEVDGVEGVTEGLADGGVLTCDVGGVCEGVDVEDGKDHHLDTHRQGRDADLDVVHGPVLSGLEDAEIAEQTQQAGLPEAEEDDEFDTQELQERS